MDPDYIYVAIGWVILAGGYTLFAFYVTRHGDFYNIRRWKAAICVALLSAILLMMVIYILVGRTILINPTLFQTPNMSLGMKLITVFQSFKNMITKLIVFLPCLTPYIFLVTIGTHHQLKWWLISDDYLDKVWKDPNKNNRSPIQWL
jgi:hypothetical protein